MGGITGVSSAAQLQCWALSGSGWPAHQPLTSSLSPWPAPCSLVPGRAHQASLISLSLLHCQSTVPFSLSFCSSSESHSLQRGCLEALHTLCSVFPPAMLPQAWGSDHNTPLLPTVISLLTASYLAWSVQGVCLPLRAGSESLPICLCVSLPLTGQQQLLDVCSALFLSSSLSASNQLAQTDQSVSSSSSWAAVGGGDLAKLATVLLQHVARLLAVFVHILEGREPETRETKVSSPSPHLSLIAHTLSRECRLWCPLRSQQEEMRLQ